MRMLRNNEIAPNQPRRVEQYTNLFGRTPGSGLNVYWSLRKGRDVVHRPEGLNLDAKTRSNPPTEAPAIKIFPPGTVFPLLNATNSASTPTPSSVVSGFQVVTASPPSVVVGTGSSSPPAVSAPASSMSPKTLGLVALAGFGVWWFAFR